MTAATPGPVDSTDAIRLALRSWPEVESYLQGCKGVIIPLGSTEQHGPTGRHRHRRPHRRSGGP